MALEFRDLRADEIECRIAQVKENGISLLLYKDARCDMNILDETVGAYNWQRSHIRDNANCIVSIWDSEKAQWISKEDVGTESNTEAQKGLASDSFKRACFNWGIGRELYTAPFIWVKPENYDLVKGKCYDKFVVQEITIEKKKITGLIIYNSSKGCVAYKMGKTSKATTTTTAAQPKATKAQPKEQAKKATPAPQPKAEEQPYEVVTICYRDEFRKFVKENNLDNDTITRILNDCNLKADSPDEEWEKGLMYGVAYIGGITQ